MPFKTDPPMSCRWCALHITFCVLVSSKALSQFENAATKAARTLLFPLSGGSEERTETEADSIPKVQITMRSGLNMLQFRDLTANTMNKLVRIPGIVISASILSSRATKLHLQCRACRSTKIVYPTGGLGGVGGGSDRGLPRVCDAPEPEGQKKDCPLDPYLIIHSKSTFADQQTLKLQEAPDMVPVGELPRHMLLSTDRYLTGKVVPGSRIVATGIYSTFQSAKNVSLHSDLQLTLFITSPIEKCRRSRTASTLPSCYSP
jgi:DNA replication licensing factor MCM5